MTVNEGVRGSNPRCLIKNASLGEALFNVRHRRNRTPDNVVDRGARRPGGRLLSADRSGA